MKIGSPEQEFMQITMKLLQSAFHIYSFGDSLNFNSRIVLFYKA